MRTWWLIIFGLMWFPARALSGYDAGRFQSLAQHWLEPMGTVTVCAGDDCFVISFKVDLQFWAAEAQPDVWKGEWLGLDGVN